MKKMSKTFALVAGMLVLGATQAFAVAPAIAIPEFGVDNAVAVGGAILLGMAVLWGIRKAVAMAGR